MKVDRIFRPARRRSPRAAAGGRSPGAAVWLAALMIAAISCAGPEPAPQFQRLIDDEPRGLLNLADHLEEVVIGSSEIDAREIARWRVQDLEGVDVAGRIAFEITGPAPSLVRFTRWPAEEIAAVRFEIAGLEGTPLTLAWSGAGEPFGGRRKLVSHALPGAAGYRYRVSEKYSWSGEIRRVQLLPSAAVGTRFEIRRIEWTRPHLPLAAREALAAGATRVDLGGDSRLARVAPPATGLDWEVRIPNDGRLLFAIGSAAPPNFSVDRTFRVVAETSEAKTRTLFEETIPAEEAEVWKDRSIDLADFGGRQLRLRFETSAANRVRGEAGLGLWGHPELYSAAGPTAAPNVVLISVDTLRADHLTLNGYGRETTPYLSMWAARYGVNFSQAVVQAPWTLPSHLSMLTGVDAYRHGVNHDGAADPEMPLLTERLRQSGYSTWAVTGGALMRPERGFDRGFDLFRYWTERYSVNELETHLEWTLERLDSGIPRPFFLFFHTYEVHSPYQARQPWFSTFSGLSAEADTDGEFADRSTGSVGEAATGGRSALPIGVLDETGGRAGWVLNQQKRSHFAWRPTTESPLQALPARLRPHIRDFYDSGIAYTDDALGRLLEALDRHGLAEDTIVVVTSDHGEALDEHDRAGHGYLFDHNLLVPLVIGYPRRLGGGRSIDRQVRSIDIVPTVLDLAGLPPLEAIDGRSLVPLIEGTGGADDELAVTYAPKSNYGLSLRRGGREKYTFNNTISTAFRGDEAVYDLVADPLESRNLAEDADDEDGAQRLAEWRELADGILDRTPGLRITLQNATDSEWSGSLEAENFRRKRVKLLSARTPSRVHHRDPRAIVFSIPPGETTVVSVESTATAPIDLEITGGPGLAEDETITHRILVEPSGEASWSSAVGDAAGAAARAFTVRVERAGSGATSDPVADAELLEQLEALGYVEED